ncbi:MAG: hypothetical protein EOP38_19575 [Rubrivivax sp.]|nr:MAG: hypothetical protein EOP38_19575 [Rubrivivax sp.]
MTRKRTIWLGLASGGVLLAALTAWCWHGLSPTAFDSLAEAASPRLARAATTSLVERQAGPAPYVRLEATYNDGQQRAPDTANGLAVTQQVRRVPGPDGDESELVFSIVNRSPVVANAVFFLQQNPLPVDPTRDHRLTAQVELDASDQRTLMGIGFHLLGPDGRYLGEHMPESAVAALKLPGPQALAATYRLSAAREAGDRVAALLVPRVSIANIEPGASLKATVRWAPVRVIAEQATPQARLQSPEAQPAATRRAGLPGMLVGNSFHRYPGVSERLFGPIRMQYQFARSLAADGMSGMEWWRGEDDYHWRDVDAWAAFHARGGRKLLVVFSGSPQWASAAPHQPSSMELPGYAAPPARRYWPAYGRMVRETVKRLKGKLVGVECWNEPNLPGSFTGTQTELADLCKLVADNARSVDAAVPVVCPQPESPLGLGFIYGARTSQGEPIHKFCDYVGTHLYGPLAHDAQGRPYSSQSIDEAMAMLRRMGTRFGIPADKRLAITEYGVAGCNTSGSRAHPLPFGRMPSSEAGDALYQSIAALQAHGVSMLALYSYDHGDSSPQCRPGGSFIRSMKLDAEGRQQPDDEVIQRVNDAVRDFGRR